MSVIFKLRKAVGLQIIQAHRSSKLSFEKSRQEYSRASAENMCRAYQCYYGSPLCIRKHYYPRRRHLEKTTTAIVPMATATRAPAKICFRVNPPSTWST